MDIESKLRSSFCLVGEIFGLGLCNCSWLSAALFRYYAISIFTFTDDVFWGPSTFTGVHFLNIFFFDDIEYAP